ncbi:MAG: hypothetical protein KJ874_10515, partial [Acidobacteria bacterium]|nr:hypothetical protein [Acidobacteriota bacterium]
ISRGTGRHLEFSVSPDDRDMARILEVLHHFLDRAFNPRRRLQIETINREAAADSPYLAPLRSFFDLTVDFNRISLYRRVS